MERLGGTLGRAAVGVVLAAAVGGCVAAAAGAAAGAAGAIAYTDRGAKADIDASVAEVIAATDATFDELEIQPTSRTLEEGDGGAVIRGEEGDTDVTVSIETGDNGLTRVQVTAREDVVAYDRDRAKEILRSIVDRT